MTEVPCSPLAPGCPFLPGSPVSPFIPGLPGRPLSPSSPGIPKMGMQQTSSTLVISLIRNQPFIELTSTKSSDWCYWSSMYKESLSDINSYSVRLNDFLVKSEPLNMTWAWVPCLCHVDQFTFYILLLSLKFTIFIHLSHSGRFWHTYSTISTLSWWVFPHLFSVW